MENVSIVTSEDAQPAPSEEVKGGSGIEPWVEVEALWLEINFLWYLPSFAQQSTTHPAPSQVNIFYEISKP